MVNVDFDEQEWQPSRAEIEASSGESGVAKLIMKTGLAKNATQANYVIVGIALLLFLISAFFFFGGSDDEVLPEAGEVSLSGQVVE